MKRGFLIHSNEKKTRSSQPTSSNQARVTGSGSSAESLERLGGLFQDALSLQRGSALANSEASTIELEQMLENVVSMKSMHSLPTQKFDGIIISDDSNRKSLSTRNFDHKTTDYDASTLVVTSIPSKPLGGRADDPDGHSEWLVHGPTKAKVVNAPGYLQSVPKVKYAEPAYVIKSTPNMGMGMFATRDIEMGELIFAERPLLVTPRSNLAVIMHLEALYPDPGMYFDLPTMQAMAMTEWEKMLKIAFDRMEPEDKKEFMKLANSHKDDGSGPIHGIVRTNSFGLGPELYDGRELRADMMNDYGGLTKIGSRINHSCMPNVHVQFSITSFSFQFTALIDIKAGEELFYSYCNSELSVAERRAKLAPYGFVCHCPACEHATPETDALRREYEDRTRHYLLTLNWAGKGGAKEGVIEPVKRLHDGLLKEGLTHTREYKSTLLMLGKFYQGIGMKEKAKPYREKYERYKRKEPAGLGSVSSS